MITKVNTNQLKLFLVELTLLKTRSINQAFSFSSLMSKTIFDAQSLMLLSLFIFMMKIFCICLLGWFWCCLDSLFLDGPALFLKKVAVLKDLVVPVGASPQTPLGGLVPVVPKVSSRLSIRLLVFVIARVSPRISV
jgi:hypothetical protein